MQRLLIFIMIGILIISLFAMGFYAFSKDNPNNQYNSNNQFITIKTFEDKGIPTYINLMYDKDTKIVYLYTHLTYQAGISPYYIMVDGAPTIAIYGINYFD